MALADLVLVNTRSGNALNGNAAGETPATSNKVADFVTQQTFVSLTGCTALVKTIWEGLKSLDDLFQSLWIAFGLCCVLGLVQFAISLVTLLGKDKGLQIGIAFTIAVLNTLVLWSAVAGVGKAGDKVGVDLG
jgi:hypothetical protein